MHPEEHAASKDKHDQKTGDGEFWDRVHAANRTRTSSRLSLSILSDVRRSMSSDSTLESLVDKEDDENISAERNTVAELATDANNDNGNSGASPNDDNEAEFDMSRRMTMPGAPPRLVSEMKSIEGKEIEATASDATTRRVDDATSSENTPLDSACYSEGTDSGKSPPKPLVIPKNPLYLRQGCLIPQCLTTSTRAKSSEKTALRKNLPPTESATIESLPLPYQPPLKLSSEDFIAPTSTHLFKTIDKVTT